MFEGVCATDHRNSRSPRTRNQGRLRYSPYDMRSERGICLFRVRIVGVVASHFFVGEPV